MTLSTRSPSDLPPLVLALGAAGCGLAMLAGVPLGGAVGTSVACLMLLVFGLPHGTLDLELIKARSRGPWTGLASLLVLYLGLATAMLALWQVAPVLALGAFILTAAVHFSEDWDGTGSRFLELGMALALLCAPTLIHRDALSGIFIGLTGQAEAAIIADLMLLVTPVALVVAVVAVSALWTSGRRVQAAGATLTLASMVVLPPIVGFALYFCFFHSPRHFRESLFSLDWRGFARWGWVVVPLTLAAGGIALVLFGLEVRAALPDRIMAASFMTLSILTVPHMLVPLLVEALSQRGKATAQEIGVNPGRHARAALAD